MRVIIAGSRDIEGDEAIRLVRNAICESGWTDEIEEIVHGDARGIDTAADRLCRSEFKSWKVTPVPADWNKYGRSAGPIRNRQMAGMADALIAINGNTRGTKNMITTACEAGLKVFIYREEACKPEE